MWYWSGHGGGYECGGCGCDWTSKLTESVVASRSVDGGGCMGGSGLRSGLLDVGGWSTQVGLLECGSLENASSGGDVEMESWYGRC